MAEAQTVLIDLCELTGRAVLGDDIRARLRSFLPRGRLGIQRAEAVKVDLIESI
jgi:hypothetical protein